MFYLTKNDHPSRYSSTDRWSSIEKISTASLGAEETSVLLAAFASPPCPFLLTPGIIFFDTLSIKRQSNLLRCFFLVFTFNDMLENAFPTLQMYGQLCLISKGLLVLCFSFISRCMPQRLPLRQYLIAIWIYKHSCFGKHWYVHFPSGFSRSCKGWSVMAKSHLGQSAGVYWAVTL